MTRQNKPIIKKTAQFSIRPSWELQFLAEQLADLGIGGNSLNAVVIAALREFVDKHLSQQKQSQLLKLEAQRIETLGIPASDDLAQGGGQTEQEWARDHLKRIDVPANRSRKSKPHTEADEGKEGSQSAK